MVLPRILIVDDDEPTCRILEKIFRQKGFDVETAQTVTLALWLLGQPFDCILADLVLPDGSGERVLEAVGASRMAANVVIMTGLADHETLDALRARYPHVVILQKPINADDVITACRRARQEPGNG